LVKVGDKHDEYRIAIQGIDQLPTISAIFQQLIELLGSEQSTAKQLSDLISKDQSITLAILKLVNSAFYGHMREITSLDQAIVMLGLNTVKSIALGTSLFKGAKKRKDRYPLDKNALWMHSLGSATASKIIAKRVGYEDIEEAFAAGLLHDVGILIFDVFFHKKYQEVLKHTRENNLYITDAEQSVLGIKHDEVGKILLLKWKLPLAIVNASAGHHDLSKASEGYQQLAGIVKISDDIVNKLQIGSEGDQKGFEGELVAPYSVKLTQKDLEEVAEEVKLNREIFEMFRLS